MTRAGRSWACPGHPRLTSFAQITPVMLGFVPGIHVFFVPRLMQDVDGRDKPGHDGNLECRHACFPPVLAPNKRREIGGGRATRQPGQVRKEAALTRSGSGRSSVSYLFFSGESRRTDTGFALDSLPSRIPQKWEPVLRS